MEEATTLPIQVTLEALWASTRPVLFTEKSVYQLDLEAGRPSVDQYRWLRRFQRTISKALCAVIERHPKLKRPPSVLIHARLGISSNLLDSLSIEVKGSSSRPGHFVCWCTKDEGEIQEARCGEPLKAARMVDRLMRTHMDSWFSRFLADEPGLDEYSYRNVYSSHAEQTPRRKRPRRGKAPRPVNSPTEITGRA